MRLHRAIGLGTMYSIASILLQRNHAMSLRSFASCLLALVFLSPLSFAQDEKKSDDKPEQKELSPAKQIAESIQDGKLRDAAKSLDEALEADAGNFQLLMMRRTLGSAFARKRNYRGAGQQYAKYANALLDAERGVTVGTIAASLTSARIYMPRAGLGNDVLPLMERANKKATSMLDLSKPSNKLKSLLSIHANYASALRSNDREEEAIKMLRDDLKTVAGMSKKDDSALAIDCHATALRNLFNTLPPGAEQTDLFGQHQKMLAAQLDKAEEPSMQLFGAYVSAGTSQISRLSRDEPEAAKTLLEAVEARLKAQSDNEDLRGMVATYMRTLTRSKSRIESGLKIKKLIGQKAPGFEVAAWVSEDGKPVELKGKVVLLDFWAIWCGPCIRTFPHLKHLKEEYGEQGFEIVGVTRYYNYTWDDEKKRAIRGQRGEEGDPDAEHETIRNFLASHDLTHASIVTPNDSKMQGEYGVTGIPHAVLIDRDGIIRMIKVGSGGANAKAIEGKIQELLSADSKTKAGAE